MANVSVERIIMILEHDVHSQKFTAQETPLLVGAYSINDPRGRCSIKDYPII